MKVAIVIPFAFEKFFKDVENKWCDSRWMEDYVIGVRSYWHMNWALSLKTTGFEVSIYHLSFAGSKVRIYYHVNGIRIVSVPTDFRSFKTKEEFSFQLLWILKKEKPDLVFSITHLFSSLFDMFDLLSYYLNFNKIPLVARNPKSDTYFVISSLSNYIEKKFKTASIPSKIILFPKFAYKMIRFHIKLYFKRKSLSLTSAFITQTNLDLINLQEKFHLPKSRLFLLPKPIDLSCFSEKTKIEAASFLSMDYRQKYILHVSNLFNTKGCEHIINLLPQLQIKHKNLVLIVTGNGKKRADLEEQTQKLNLKEKVLFVGQISHEELVYYYNLSDVFVLPTEIIGEGQPNVIMEAIACNTVPISNDLPGPSSVITEGLGLIVKLGDNAMLYDKILMVLNGEYTLDQKKRDVFLSKYSLTNVGNELKNIFERIALEKK